MGRYFNGEQRVLGAMLLLVPLTWYASRAGWPSWAQFFLAVGSVIPLAGYIGASTESLAETLGGRVGGLLNATFGNAPDLLVGVFGVQKGLIPLVKATLVGALISNSALIMGLCYITAGLRFGRPRFNRLEAGHHSVLMMLTLAAILFPSLGSFAMCGGRACHSGAAPDILQHVSVAIAVVLLLAYVVYVLYAIFGLERLGGLPGNGRDSKVLEERAADTGEVWPNWFSVLVLALTTVALVPTTDILTGAVAPVTSVLGWSEVFVGMVVVANAGNVAEGYAALKFAFSRGGTDPEMGDTGLDLSLSIASASSIQIATFVAPLVVLYSLTGHNMNLVFSPVEIGILSVLVIVFAYIGQDGESNWLEGAQLLALYLMAAVVFYALPVSAFA